MKTTKKTNRSPLRIELELSVPVAQTFVLFVKSVDNTVDKAPFSQYNPQRSYGEGKGVNQITGCYA
jgi:hypothetical protein